MQRYRVNYRLLATLVVGLVVAAPAAYLLWKFQVHRNAERLLAQADAAEEKSDDQEAYDSLSQYVKLRKEEPEALLRLGHAAVKLSKKDDIDVKVRSEAYFALIGAVQYTEKPEVFDQLTDAQKADVHTLQRALVDMHMKYGYMDRALQAIEDLIVANEADAELLGLKAQCLFLTQNAGAVDWAYKCIGYDQKAEAFDVAKGLAPDQPKVYAMLAQTLFANRQKELAERVINQLVVANPESRDAYVYQFQILSALDRTEEARAAIEKAYALDPKDSSVLQAKGAVAINDYQKALEEADKKAHDEADKPETAAAVAQMRKDAEKHLDEASKYFVEGKKNFPEMIGFYEQVARIAFFRQQMDESLAVIEDGLKKFDLQKHINSAGVPIAMGLESQKIDILFFKRDMAGIRKEVKALRELQSQRVQALADYYEARIEIANQNWLEAARRLNEVKFRLLGDPNLQALASASQAACHAQLGQYDLALAAYNWALEKNSRLLIARAGVDEMTRYLGQDNKDDTALQFDDVIAKMLKLPPEQQNWTLVEEKINEYVKKQAELRSASQSWIDSRSELLRAQMYVTRATNTTDEKQKKELFAKAREAVTRAYNLDKEDVSVQLAAPRVLMLDPTGGPAEALKLLDKFIALNKTKNKPETLPYRLLRIELLFALHDEQLSNQLRAATEGMDDWDKDNQAQVWAAVGNRFEQLGQLPDAELCLKEAAKLSPSSLLYRVALFELARKQASDEGMRAAQEGLLELLKDPTAPDYVLTEVKRQMVAAATGAITKDDLKKSRRLLDDAIKKRPTWGELYVLSGQLYMVLENDPAKALASFDQALQTGPANLNAVNLQVRLLAELGRYAEARKMMERIPETAWAQILDRTAANVLLNSDEAAKGFAEAKKLADANPTDAATQIWFADVAARANELTAAEAAFKKALEINPSVPEYWSALLNFYMVQKRGPEVESTLRLAQLALDEEFLTLLTAQQHRLFGRFPQAESIFLSAYGDKLDQPAVAQRMAEFYLGWGEQDPTYRGKAARYLNTILRAANEGKLQPTDSIATWARRQAARLFSLNGDYKDSLKAEQLLTAAVASNASNQESTEMLVDILNRRGDPASRKRMAALLRKIQKERPLQPQYELLLGQAMFDVGDWSECERQMQDAIARYPNDVALRVGLIEMLIARKDAAGAERWLSRLSSIKDGPPAIPQLRVHLAAAKGDKGELRKQLVAITPNLNVLNADQLKIVHSVALLADAVGDHEYALKLITEFSRRTPGNEFELAQFTAQYGDAEAGLNMLLQLFPGHIDQVLSAAIEALRTRRKDDPAKIDAIVDGMVRRALNDDPEGARRMVQAAEVLEIEEKYPEAIAAYTKLLERDDVPSFVRATALNNRSFLLAITKQDLDLALEGVNQAMDILGPISDILDTRGLVYLHRGEFKPAVEDLKLAVTMKATPSKYFHLAEALLGAGEEKLAVEAWKEAVTRGISLDAIPTVEHPDLEKAVKKFESLGAPVPKA